MEAQRIIDEVKEARSLAQKRRENKRKEWEAILGMANKEKPRHGALLEYIRDRVKNADIEGILLLLLYTDNREAASAVLSAYGTILKEIRV